MPTAAAIPPGEIVGTADQRVYLRGVPWAHFEAILALRGDAPAPRLTYLTGVLELMTPSRNHESIKKTIARLIELYALRAGVRLSGYGGWTLRSAPKELAIEPDECYIVGDPRLKDVPDLAVEVVWTSGGLEKLEVYRGIGVDEVWQWRDGMISVHRLEGDRYVQIQRSRLFPDLDVALVARLAGYEDQHDAVLALQAALDEQLGQGRPR
ncbi:MAG TPA: Uma2 family endonuclease [Thermoanaerobaculia bacterium]|nr:Uma2 family endonuclease [Thermoanaerobaculia bacterium]